MNKKGILAIAVTIILVILVIITVIIITRAIMPSKERCFQNYAKDFCLKNNLSFYKIDMKAHTFSCWTNKARGETKTFYPQKDLCK